MKRPNKSRCNSANRAQRASATALSTTPPRSGPQTVPAPPKMAMRMTWTSYEAGNADEGST